MTEKRFKELLNLHLDHCLSAEEAGELANALRADPQRLKTLRRYEAMNGACAALFARSAAQAPSSLALRRALSNAEARIEQSRKRTLFTGWENWAISGGLAACVALVVAKVTLPAVRVAHSPKTEEIAVNDRYADKIILAKSAASGGKTQPASLDLRQGQVTFAALGLEANSANASTASRWILNVDTSDYVLEGSSMLGGSIAQPDNSHTPWGSITPSATFSSRSFGAFSTSTGIQAENTSFTFER